MKLVSAKDKQPLVSVYMPTHNRKQLLKRAVDSVLSQSYENIELLIVNDGSTDGTKEFLEEIKKQDSRIKVFSYDEAKGACYARNVAIEAASGEFITGLDDDDEFLPNRIESLLNAYDEKYSFITSALYWDYGKSRRIVDSRDVEITLEDVLSHKFATPQMLTKTQYLKDSGMFDTDMPTCQDWDAWTRLIITKGKAKKISDASYVIHTAHDGKRISVSSRKVEGMKRFIQKFERYMTPTNHKDLCVALAIKEQRSMGVLELMKNVTQNNFRNYLKFWLDKRLPLFVGLFRSVTKRQ
ncbi:MAG: glycosyltransferase [Alteromonadaceae bacterium]|nr:glycosyltransferase [Alteromonadaceae bacterium]